MASIKIFWTKTAIRQRNYVFEYWNNRNKSTSYSKKLNKKIKERINHLKSHSEIGKKTDYKNHRSISLGHYSIIYLREDNKIYISAFWDNRQDPKKLIKYLKKK